MLSKQQNITLPLNDFYHEIDLIIIGCNQKLPFRIDEEKLQNVPLLLSFTELISFFPVNRETIGGRKEIPFLFH